MPKQGIPTSSAKLSRKARLLKFSGWAFAAVVLTGNVLAPTSAADKSPTGGLPVIATARPGNSGQNTASLPRAPKSMPIWWGGNSFILLPASNMSDSPTTASGYEYAIRGPLDTRWQTLRNVFALRGDEQKSDFAWQISGVGKNTGSLYLNLHGLASWSYNSSNAITSGCAVSGAPLPSRAPRTQSGSIGTPCPPAIEPLPLSQALNVAKRIHAEVGGPINVEWKTQSNPYSGSVEVTAVPLLDGVRASSGSSTSWHYSINSDAKVNSASGSFAQPVAMSGLPILGARSAAERVNSKQWSAFGPFSIGGFPVEIMKATDSRVIEPRVPGQINVAVDRVSVTNPTATLVEFWNSDGTLMLLPGYQYSADAHRTFAVISVSDERVTFTQVDHGGIQPMMK